MKEVNICAEKRGKRSWMSAFTRGSGMGVLKEDKKGKREGESYSHTILSVKEGNRQARPEALCLLFSVGEEQGTQMGGEMTGLLKAGWV